MLNRLKIFSILLITNISLGYSQSFQNGDLDGVVIGNSCLPFFWANVPISDPNCLALQTGNDTPDLTSISAPTPSIGMNGNPFSGATFVSGIFASNLPSFFQEGIMQSVSSFAVGQIYRIHFRQSIVKNNYALDKSGSWAVFIDTVLAAVSSPTYSVEPFNSINLNWEARSVTFTASANNHLIKFLPHDDDTNWFFSNSDTTGALYMGIDSIGLEVLTGVNNINNRNEFILFPNPNKGSFKLQYNGILNKTTLLYITDVYGKLIDTKEILNTTTDYENTSLTNGLYFYSLRSNNEELQRGKFVVVK
jgi:hypothetical protein